MVKVNFQIFVYFLLFSLIIVSSVNAHPGRTDSSGCHTCRTNCPGWGLSYGEYHCHNGGGSIQEQPTVYIPPAEPTDTPLPLPTWTPIPTDTIIPTLAPTNTTAPTTKIIPSSTPSVLGEQSNQSSSPTSSILGYGLLGLIGYGIYKYRKSKKNTQA